VCMCIRMPLCMTKFQQPPVTQYTDRSPCSAASQPGPTAGASRWACTGARVYTCMYMCMTKSQQPPVTQYIDRSPCSADSQPGSTAWASRWAFTGVHVHTYVSVYDQIPATTFDTIHRSLTLQRGLTARVHCLGVQVGIFRCACAHVCLCV